jgi:hypothetical protein
MEQKFASVIQPPPLPTHRAELYIDVHGSQRTFVSPKLANEAGQLLEITPRQPEKLTAAGEGSLGATGERCLSRSPLRGGGSMLDAGTAFP